MGRTTIEVDEETRDRLRRWKAQDGLTYDEAIDEVLDELEAHRAERRETIWDERARKEIDGADPTVHLSTEIEAVDGEDVQDDVDDDKIPLDCPHCGYHWDYGGDMDQATCPSCKGTVPADV